ncbi:calsequestrin-2-like [Sycon ciliatum]|uniref:calsequestrin-2-like n=1 Tax=Sycon ciliatum TaxID=27933 RepID=UPI0031F6E8EF
MGMPVSAACVLLLLASPCLVWGQPQGQPQGMPRGGVLQLTEKNFVKTVQSTPVTLVCFLSGGQADASYEGYLVQQLEYVAALMREKGPNGVKIASVDAATNPGLLQQLGVQPEARPVMLFRAKASPQEYFGQRTAEGIAQFLTEVITNKPVRMVSTKAEKKRYEEFEFAKVVAYVEPGSKMEKWFTAAGEHFVPSIPFYQVTDKKIAKSLRLKKSGAGLFVKPNEKPISFPSNVTEDRSLIRFVYANRKQALMQVRMMEMHLTWSGVLSPNLFFAVLKPKSESGARFFGSLKTVAKHFAGDKSLNLAWIDTASDMQQMLPQWAKTFDREDLATTSASFGFIDLAKNKHAWLDLTEKDTISKPKRVIDWITSALAGEVELKETVRPEAAQPKPDAEEDFDIPEDGAESSERTEL